MSSVPMYVVPVLCEPALEPVHSASPSSAARHFGGEAGVAH